MRSYKSIRLHYALALTRLVQLDVRRELLLSTTFSKKHHHDKLLYLQPSKRDHLHHCILSSLNYDKGTLVGMPAFVRKLLSD